MSSRSASSIKLKKQAVSIKFPDSSDIDSDEEHDSLALTSVAKPIIRKSASAATSVDKKALTIIKKEKSGDSKSNKATSSKESQMQIIPGFGDIWCKITNNSKVTNRDFDTSYEKFKNYFDMLNFVLKHGFHFKNIIDIYKSILCATLAEKESSLGWNCKLFIIVQNPSTNVRSILQMSDNEKPYKEYDITKDSNILCSDVLRNDKIHYQMTICNNRKKLITIQLPSLKERTFWRECLSTEDLLDD